MLLANICETGIGKGNDNKNENQEEPIIALTHLLTVFADNLDLFMTKLFNYSTSRNTKTFGHERMTTLR
jgi:hypothetical protein